MYVRTISDTDDAITKNMSRAEKMLHKRKIKKTIESDPSTIEGTNNLSRAERILENSFNQSRAERILQSKFSRDTNLVTTDTRQNDLDTIANEIVNSKTTATNKQVVENIATSLKNKYKHIKLETVTYMIVSNRKAIAKRVAKIAIQIAISCGITYALATVGNNIFPGFSAAASAAASSGLPGWFLSFYMWMRRLGFDKIAINRVFLLLKNKRALGSEQPIIKIPEILVKNKIASKIFNPIYNSTAYSVGEKLVSEGIAIAVDGPMGYVQNMALSLAINKALPSAKNVTTSAANKVVGVYRKMTSELTMAKQSPIITKKKTVKEAVEYIANTANSQLDSELSSREKTILNSIENRKHKDLGVVLEYADNKKGDPTMLAKAVTNVAKVSYYAATAASAIALNMYLNKNSAIQSAAIGMILNSTGIDNFIAKMGSNLTTGVLGKLFDLKQKVALDGHISPEIKTQFISLILGENIYSDSAIKQMNKVEIKAIFDKHGIHKSRYPGAKQSAEVWRAALIKHQQEMLAITREYLIEVISENLFKASSTALVVNAINTGYQSYESVINEVANSATLSKLANLSPKEIAAIISSKAGTFIPTFGKTSQELLQPELISGQKKIDEFLVENPELATELNKNPMAREPEIAVEDPTIAGILPDGTILRKTVDPETTTSTSQRDAIKMLREERRKERIALETDAKVAKDVYIQEQIQKYAIKYKIPDSKLDSIKTMRDLEVAIREKLSNPSVDTPVSPALKFGTLKDEDLLDRDTADILKNIEIDPIYNSIKRYAVSNVESWVPGYGYYKNMISNINLGIDSINYGKNVYNIALALKKSILFKSGSSVENLPFAPLANIDKIDNIKDFLMDNLEFNKINAYEVVLNSIKNKIINGLDNKQFLLDLATNIAGKETATKDLEKIIEMLKPIVDNY